MEYYSNKTRKLYKTVEELEKAEKAFDEAKAAELKKREEREVRAKEVEDAYNKFVELFNAFVKDYGYYVEFKKTNNNLSLFDLFFNHWPF